MNLQEYYTKLDTAYEKWEIELDHYKRLREWVDAMKEIRS